MTDKLTSILHRMVTTDSEGEATAALNQFRKIAGKDILDMVVGKRAGTETELIEFWRERYEAAKQALDEQQDSKTDDQIRTLRVKVRHLEEIITREEKQTKKWMNLCDQVGRENSALLTKVQEFESDVARLRLRPLVYKAHNIISNHAA